MEAICIYCFYHGGLYVSFLPLAYARGKTSWHKNLPVVKTIYKYGFHELFLNLYYLQAIKNINTFIIILFFSVLSSSLPLKIKSHIFSDGWQIFINLSKLHVYCICWYCYIWGMYMWYRNHPWPNRMYSNTIICIGNLNKFFAILFRSFDFLVPKSFWIGWFFNI
jgi:hypothetical protein